MGGCNNNSAVCFPYGDIEVFEPRMMQFIPDALENNCITPRSSFGVAVT